MSTVTLFWEVPPVFMCTALIDDVAGGTSVDSTVLHLFGTLASVLGEATMLDVAVGSWVVVDVGICTVHVIDLMSVITCTADRKVRLIEKCG